MFASSTSITNLPVYLRVPIRTHQQSHLTVATTTSYTTFLSLKAMPDLPDDIWLCIFKNIDPRTVVLSMRLVNRRLYELSRTNDVWRYHLAETRRTMLTLPCVLDKSESKPYCSKAMGADEVIIKATRISKNWMENDVWSPEPRELPLSEAEQRTIVAIHHIESSDLFISVDRLGRTAILDCSSQSPSFEPVHGHEELGRRSCGMNHTSCFVKKTSTIILASQDLNER